MLYEAAAWSRRSRGRRSRPCSRIRRSRSTSRTGLARATTGSSRRSRPHRRSGPRGGGISRPSTTATASCRRTIPELTIAVRPGERGRGIGSALLTALLDEARARELPALSLSVSERNPALRLYERARLRMRGALGDPGRWCAPWTERSCGSGALRPESRVLALLSGRCGGHVAAEVTLLARSGLTAVMFSSLPLPVGGAGGGGRPRPSPLTAHGGRRPFFGEVSLLAQSGLPSVTRFPDTRYP